MKAYSLNICKLLTVFNSVIGKNATPEQVEHLRETLTTVLNHAGQTLRNAGLSKDVSINIGSIIITKTDTAPKDAGTGLTAKIQWES